MEPIKLGSSGGGFAPLSRPRPLSFAHQLKQQSKKTLRGAHVHYNER